MDDLNCLSILFTSNIFDKKAAHTLSYGFLDDCQIQCELTFYLDEINSHNLTRILTFLLDCVVLHEEVTL